MAEPNFSNLKRFVRNLIDHNFQFGSFKASKEALEKKYGKPRGPLWGYDNAHYDYYTKDNINIAGINYQRKMVKKGGINIITDEFEGVKEITTKDFNYATNSNQDKFVRIYNFDKTSNCTYSIIDSNNNGHVDENDTINIAVPLHDKDGWITGYNKITKSLKDFLMNN